MRYLLKNQFKIPKWAFEEYLKCCPICTRKKRIPQAGLVVKPILTSTFNERCQVDLIDLQSVPDGSYKWVMQYQDHLTKYCILRPLHSKRADEVAKKLFKIFCDFGAPQILQADNGREFTAEVVEEVVKLWPGCKMLHGRPRYPQSQGSVERSNGDVKNMLMSYMAENKTTEWSKALRVVQWRKNCALQRTINRSPYEAVFGNMPATRLVEEDLVDDPEEGT